MIEINVIIKLYPFGNQKAFNDIRWLVGMLNLKAHYTRNQSLSQHKVCRDTFDISVASSSLGCTDESIQISFLNIVRWNICDIMWDRNLEFGGTYDWEYSNRKSR